LLKDGWKTTEFWVTVLTDAGLLISSVAGVLPAKYAALGASISTALYAVARGLAKLNVPLSKK